MPLKKLLLSFSIISSSIPIVYAQKDYVVTTKKDTLWGKISNYNLEKVKYRQTDSSDKQKYTPMEIDAFHLDKKQTDYQAVQLPKEDRKVFLLRLESGKIRLFEHVESVYTYGGGSGSSRSWYAVKGNEAPVEVKSNSKTSGRKARRQAFYSLIEDNKALAEEYYIADIFSFDQIRKFIKLYNTAAGK